MKIKGAVTKEASNLVPEDYQLEKTVSENLNNIMRQGTIRERSKLTQTYSFDTSGANKKTLNRCVGVSKSLTNPGKSPNKR